MNFKKYTKSAFEACGLNTPEARKLADELENDVSQEIHIVVLEEFRKMIDALNAQGHNLKIDGEIRIGEISFRDETKDGQCHLRLGCDVVVSAGYSDMTD